MTRTRQALGRRAEQLARDRLEQEGWRIVASNVRTRSGEIDLIALDRSTLVFIEVKAGREGASLGPVLPAHAVDRRKQRRVRRLATEWLAAGGAPRGVAGYRFDVIGVSFDANGPTKLDHIRAAF